MTALHEFGGALGRPFGHFLLGSHKFMVTALGSCVKWGLGIPCKVSKPRALRIPHTHVVGAVVVSSLERKPGSENGVDFVFPISKKWVSKSPHSSTQWERPGYKGV